MEANVEIQLPEVFPPPSILMEDVKEAIKEFISRNSLRQSHSILSTVLGENNKKIFDDSIVYRQFNTVPSALSMFTGTAPVTQVLGKVLNDADVFKLKLVDPTCIIKGGAHKDTCISIYRSDDGMLSNAVLAELRVPKDILSGVIQRYLRFINSSGQVYFDSANEGYDSVKWLIPANHNTAEGLDTVIERLDAALTVYYKLLTRMPTCQSFSNALPRFQNTQIQEQTP